MGLCALSAKHWRSQLTHGFHCFLTSLFNHRMLGIFSCVIYLTVDTLDHIWTVFVAISIFLFITKLYQNYIFDTTSHPLKMLAARVNWTKTRQGWLGQSASEASILTYVMNTGMHSTGKFNSVSPRSWEMPILASDVLQVTGASSTYVICEVGLVLKPSVPLTLQCRGSWKVRIQVLREKGADYKSRKLK